MSRQRDTYLAKRRANFPTTYDRIVADPERAKKRRDYDNAQRKKARDWLAKYKTDRGCVDCGYAKHFAALQLDHVGPKTRAIADCRTSPERLQREITAGACVVRCANCHAIKTYERRLARKRPPC